MTTERLPAQRRGLPLAGRTGRSGVLTTLAVVGALVLVGLAAVAVQQVLASYGALAGDGWVVQAMEWIGALPVAWAAVIGIGVVVLGILLVATALAAGRPRELQLPARHGLVVTDGDVARLASATALSVSGVLSASSVAAQRRLTVNVSATGSDRTVADVEAAVTGALAGLGLQRQVRVIAQTPSPVAVTPSPTGSTSPTTRSDQKEALNA